MKKKLDAYRGKLSTADLAKGMTVAGRNARRLADDAAPLVTPFDAGLSFAFAPE